MGKQRHDIGWKKRQPTSKPEAMGSTETMARRLVSRNLASVQILEPTRVPQSFDPRATRTRSK